MVVIVQPSQGRKKCGDKNDSERLRRVSSVVSTKTCSGMLRFPDSFFFFYRDDQLLTIYRILMKNDQRGIGTKSPYRVHCCPGFPIRTIVWTVFRPTSREVLKCMSEPSAYIKTFHWFWAVNLTLFSRPSVTPRFLLGISCPYSEDPETLNQQVAKRSRRRGKDVKKKQILAESRCAHRTRVRYKNCLFGVLWAGWHCRRDHLSWLWRRRYPASAFSVQVG